MALFPLMFTVKSFPALAVKGVGGGGGGKVARANQPNEGGYEKKRTLHGRADRVARWSCMQGGPPLGHFEYFHCRHLRLCV
jgi:hypothetical protein